MKTTLLPGLAVCFVFNTQKGHFPERIMTFFNCTPGEIRTPDTRLRKPLLYPTELQGQKTDQNLLTGLNKGKKICLKISERIPRHNPSIWKFR